MALGIQRRDCELDHLGNAMRGGHPRDSEVVSSEAFGQRVAAIWQDLREEASRGIEADEARVRRGDGGRASP